MLVSKVVRAVAAGAAVCALVGCSSSGSKSAHKAASTTTSTVPATATTTKPAPPPTPAQVAAVKAYLAGPGQHLMVAERLFHEVYDTGKAPTLQECNALAARLQSQAGDTNKAQALMRKIPEPTLPLLFRNDLNTKNSYLALCRYAGADEKTRAYYLDGVHRFAKPLRARLKYFGIAI
jgi:hypothetical protein